MGLTGGNRADAEDLVAEVWMAAHRHAAELREPARPWFYGVLRNKAIDRSRRHKRRPTYVPIDEPANEQIDYSADPEGGYIANASFEECLAFLLPQQQDVFVAVVIEGLSYVDAGRKLKITEWAVRGRLHRAKDRLKRCLAAKEAA